MNKKNSRLSNVSANQALNFILVLFYQQSHSMNYEICCIQRRIKERKTHYESANSVGN